MNFLFKHKNNSALVLFRMFFGFLMLAESWGAILTGWVKETFVEVPMTFTFMGFEWTQFLLGETMYFYYFIMGIFGIGIMLGYRYLWSCIGFATLWSLTYFMQKSHYNNHYYLVMLYSWMMCLVPAHKRYSLDVKQDRVKKQNSTPNWTLLLFIVQISIVYFYASFNKIYPDWLDAKPIAMWFKYKSGWVADVFGKEFFLVDLMQQRTFQLFVAYSGILYDGLIIPLLLFKRTRTIALICSVFFHLFNSLIFQVGIFPYFALSLSIFFYPPEQIERLFFRTKSNISKNIKPNITAKHRFFIWIGIAYFVWQFLLPLRHFIIPGNVFWTEEGHRLSWRMMLRTRNGSALFFKESKEKPKQVISINKFTSKNQRRDIRTKPDMIWQMAQKLKQVYTDSGETNVKIYVRCFNSVNGRKNVKMINDTIDIANTEWNTFGHQEWLLDPPKDYIFKF